MVVVPRRVDGWNAGAAAAAGGRAFEVDAEATRRVTRTTRGFELGVDARATTRALRESLERGEARTREGRLETRAGAGGTVAWETVNDEGAVEMSRAEAMEIVCEGLLCELERVRRRERAEDGGGEGEGREKRARSESGTPQTSPAKGTSLGRWMRDATRERPKLKALEEAEGRRAE